MRLPDPARVLAVTAAAAGAALLGVSVGGVASVDAQLRAVAPGTAPAPAPAPARSVDRVLVVDHEHGACSHVRHRHAEV